MISRAGPLTIQNLLAQSEYVIPIYQRDYSWTNSQWEDLFDDLTVNNPGHFIGSILCITHNENHRYEVVDGQQRLTTISILASALYSKLLEIRNIVIEIFPNDIVLDENISEMRRTLKDLLVYTNGFGQPAIKRLTLQNNEPTFIDDLYAMLLERCQLVDTGINRANAGNTRIHIAHRFFKEKIDRELAPLQNYTVEEQTREQLSKLYDITRNLTSAIIVRIETQNISDAFTLFETINSTGLPLKKTDLMKSIIISRFAPDQRNEIARRWANIIANTGNDTEQERFFRHFYNSEKSCIAHDFGISDIPATAEKSNIVDIISMLAINNPRELITRLESSSEYYSNLIISNNTDIRHHYDRLARAQGTPGYILLMHLNKKREDYNLNEQSLETAANLLTSFAVRRNLTNTPPTRSLTRIFINLIDIIENRQGNRPIIEIITDHLRGISVDDNTFLNNLKDDIYLINAKLAKFILAEIAQTQMNAEAFSDLWAERKGRPVWTVEHILPQGERLPPAWVDVLQPYLDNSNPSIRDIQNRFAHKLGNLTLTGFNAHLGNMSFLEKRDRTEGNIYIGYRNGISLNTGLINMEDWKPEDIQRRTDELAQAALNLFSFI